jgi:monovalent cation:H+ antiporter-2, CPA2 family
MFEVGLELSTSKLRSLGADVFVLGTAQFLVTAGLIGGVTMMAGLSAQTAIVIGAGLALSSSAFVLQLLGERGEMGARYGRAAFGILLLQDLAVVPVLVLTPLLAGSGGASAVMTAISIASIKAVIALALIFFLGKTVLQPVFRLVSDAKSHEAFIATILFVALGTSALTAGLGLSDTLGAFLAGVMLAETKYAHQVEADIKPFRGILLGLFFITVGFSVDLQLAFANCGTVFSMVAGLMAMKAAVIAAAGLACGISAASAVRTGLMLSQGGEFAFVIFGLAQKVGVLPLAISQLLLLVVTISMGLTPTFADLGRRIAGRLERQRGLIGVREEDADTADATDFVLVAGYGRVGQSVCDMLDAKLVRYIAFDMSPARVIGAREKGLPVLFGDATRPEVLKTAGAGRAHAVVVTLDDMDAALRAVQSIRREFGEDLEIFCRARDAKYQRLLKAAGATAIVPELLEASLLLGGAVLLSYGTPADEVNSLIQESRRSNLGDLGTASRGVSESLGSQFAMSTDANDAAVQLVSLVKPTAAERVSSISSPDVDPATMAAVASSASSATATVLPAEEIVLESEKTVARDENIYASGDEDDSGDDIVTDGDDIVTDGDTLAAAGG